MSDDTLIQIQELIDSAMSSLKTANSLLREVTGVTDSNHERHMTRAATTMSSSTAGGKIIEGIFDGQNMVDSSGQTYPVPANYASKSKLVEGDGMKLTITDEGKFIYKQISPTPRRTALGVLISEDGQYKVLAEGKAFRTLLASVTFYRAEVGDQVTILLPQDGDAKWGAIEAVIPKHMAEASARARIEGGAFDDIDGELSPSL
ncbi:MAG: hypothetical protein JWM56_1113 [Candidatus Peribacteria bacterium]|nr:hypothetical protein [Candidatus Peribacteria bacterium]